MSCGSQTVLSLTFFLVLCDAAVAAPVACILRANEHEWLVRLVPPGLGLGAFPVQALL